MRTSGPQTDINMFYFVFYIVTVTPTYVYSTYEQENVSTWSNISQMYLFQHIKSLQYYELIGRWTPVSLIKEPSPRSRALWAD